MTWETVSTNETSWQPEQIVPMGLTYDENLPYDNMFTYDGGYNDRATQYQSVNNSETSWHTVT